MSGASAPLVTRAQLDRMLNNTASRTAINVVLGHEKWVKDQHDRLAEPMDNYEMSTAMERYFIGLRLGVGHADPTAHL